MGMIALRTERCLCGSPRPACWSDCSIRSFIVRWDWVCLSSHLRKGWRSCLAVTATLVSFADVRDTVARRGPGAAALAPTTLGSKAGETL
jgi:hypothetical protein